MLGRPSPSARAMGRVRRASGLAEIMAGEGWTYDLEMGDVKTWTTV